MTPVSGWCCKVQGRFGLGVPSPPVLEGPLLLRPDSSRKPEKVLTIQYVKHKMYVPRLEPKTLTNTYFPERHTNRFVFSVRVRSTLQKQILLLSPWLHPLPCLLTRVRFRCQSGGLVDLNWLRHSLIGEQERGTWRRSKPLHKKVSCTNPRTGLGPTLYRRLWDSLGRFGVYPNPPEVHTGRTIKRGSPQFPPQVSLKLSVVGCAWGLVTVHVEVSFSRGGPVPVDMGRGTSLSLNDVTFSESH